MAITDIINVEISEKELIKVEFTEKEIVGVNLNVLDIGKGLSDLILNETPVNVSDLPSKRFRILNPILSNSLQVFLNGLKIHSSEITIHSSTEFSFPINILEDDLVECTYIKQ